MPMVRRWHQELHIKPYHRKCGVGSEKILGFVGYCSNAQRVIDTKNSNIKILSCYNCNMRTLSTNCNMRICLKYNLRFF